MLVVGRAWMMVYAVDKTGWRLAMRNILLAYDGSDNAKRALQYIIDFATDAPKDRKSTRLNSSHMSESRMPSSA